VTIVRRGIPEVPMDVGSKEEMRRFLSDLRQTVVDLRGSQVPPTPPTNFKATPIGFGVLLQWTRGLHADGTEVLWSLTPTLASAVVIDAGSGHQYVDYTSNTTKRFYWIRSYDNHAPVRSRETGPVNATPLASGTSVAAPTAPPANQGQTRDTTTGRVVDRYGRNRFNDGV
jgi:hypothetical protein